MEPVSTRDNRVWKGSLTSFVRSAALSFARSLHSRAHSLRSLPCGMGEIHESVFTLKFRFKETKVFNVVTRNTPMERCLAHQVGFGVFVPVSSSHLISFYITVFWWWRLNCVKVGLFLVADTQLYKRLCPSVRWFRDARVENAHLWYCSCHLVCGCVSAWHEWLERLGWGWGLDAPAHPSATILWPRVTCLKAESHSLIYKSLEWKVKARLGNNPNFVIPTDRSAT